MPSSASSRRPLRVTLPSAKGRVLAMLFLAAMLALIASFDQLHGLILTALQYVEPLIRERPIAGAVAFILFSAASAMLMFVSAGMVVPVGVYAWGEPVTILLLWTGWILGGIIAYNLAFHLGRPVIQALSLTQHLARYENLVSSRASFGTVVLFQMGVPSEVPGYLLGLARYPFWKFIAAMALAELPYAIATVYLGSSFIEQRIFLLVGVAAAIAALFGWALYTLRQRVWKGTRAESEKPGLS